MTVAVDLGSGATKIAGGDDPPVRLADPIDPELAARVGTTVPLIRRDGSVVITQAPHDAYVRAVATALDGAAAESVAIAVPDWWAKRAREVVERTFQAHAAGPFQLVSPAVAAATVARRAHRLPATLAVLDIGAESSSATVLTEVDGEYRVAGRPAVLHGQAGNEIDRRLMNHVLGWLGADGHEFEPTDPEIVAAGQSLLTQVKAAKEQLSTRPAARLMPGLPGANVELRLVRSEFDEVAHGTVDAVVAMLKASVEGQGSTDVEAVVLIGGSVSIPLVTQVISVELGLPVVLDQDPATLAVRGAATIEMPAPPPRKGWRRRRGRSGAPRVLDLSNAPAPDSEPYVEPVPEPSPAPSPEPPGRHMADAAGTTRPGSGVPDEAGSDTRPGRRLGGFIDLSRREAAATQRESAPEPVHIVVGSGDAPRPNLAARWASATEGSGWDSARHAYVDDEGQFSLRVNDRDYEMDMGTELASTSVTVLLIGLHVFITLTETGELLRELRLDPDHDFRPE